MNVLRKMKMLDMFAKSMTFENESSRKFNTVAGGIFSIIFGLFCLSLALVLGSDFYQRKVATVTSSEELKDTAIIDLDDLPLLMGFFDKSGANIVDPFEVVAVSLTKVTINNSISIEYSSSFVSCDSKMFPEFESDIDKMIQSSPYQFICYNSSVGEHIKNNLGDTDSITYMIEITKCDSSKRRCHPNLEQIISGFYAAIHYVNQYLNPRNFSYPLSTSVESISQLLSSGFTKYHYLKTAENTFISDDGWLNEHLITREYHSFFSLTSDINTSVISQFNGNEVLYSIALEATKVTRITVRSYMKLADVFAKIGGLVTVVFYALRVILSLYYSYKYTCLIKGIYIDAASQKDRFSLCGSIAPTHISPINPINNQPIKINDHTVYTSVNNIQSGFAIINFKESNSEELGLKKDNFFRYLMSMIISCIYPKTYRRYKKEKLEVHNTLSIKTYISLLRILMSKDYCKESGIQK